MCLRPLPLSPAPNKTTQGKRSKKELDQQERAGRARWRAGAPKHVPCRWLPRLGGRRTPRLRCALGPSTPCAWRSPQTCRWPSPRVPAIPARELHCEAWRMRVPDAPAKGAATPANSLPKPPPSNRGENQPMGGKGKGGKEGGRGREGEPHLRGLPRKRCQPTLGANLPDLILHMEDVAPAMRGTNPCTPSCQALSCAGGKRTRLKRGGGRGGDGLGLHSPAGRFNSASSTCTPQHPHEHVQQQRQQRRQEGHPPGSKPCGSE